MENAYNLDRFLLAQENIYDQVVKELKAGSKKSHWMWFIFPQLRGLGSSLTAREYAIDSLSEARTYISHPVLGARLIECISLVIDARKNGKTVEEVFGYPDYLKFHSCMTLFSLAGSENPVFKEAIDSVFEGRLDQASIDIIGSL